MLNKLIRSVVDVRAGEIRALALSFIYFFFLLASYYIIRPIRDDMGVAGGVEKLPWLFTGTLAGMLLVNPLFSALVTRLPRRQFIPISYRFFIANLLLFFILLKILPNHQQIWIGRCFYIWTSIFNLFVVSVFWGFLADTFSVEQGKRLFGFISVGGTLGGIVGAAITAALAEKIGPVNLLLVCMVMLEFTVQCVRHFPDMANDNQNRIDNDDKKREQIDQPIGGSILSGISHVSRSGYLIGICGYMLLFAITSTILYFQQSNVAAQAFSNHGARTAFFARIDLIVNYLTVLTQAFITGRIIKSIGVGMTLAILPLMSIVGFSLVGCAPILVLVVGFQILRRAGNFSLARPAREVLFTVVDREDKYKAKNFIDTAIYRLGDQIGAWSYTFFGFVGLGMAKISFIAAPLAAIWLLISIWLGRRQVALAKDRDNQISQWQKVEIKSIG